jgi:hypothetical protein
MGRSRTPKTPDRGEKMTEENTEPSPKQTALGERPKEIGTQDTKELLRRKTGALSVLNYSPMPCTSRTLDASGF